ncbi:TonB-dependent receptor [Novosphingobium taihuense]|uniref:Outer membrane receptor protein involved in Fe transport n=1 Tax=Novosphingobium taihuense TaxID=260085 RepID=A0A7W7EUG9_9SPHN|nr:TonB-dependent receptor [Novosphingobium taihuense]MBB4613999.1 outer membrane receptor protein involved in Fe transport [Novosphingobium taihuense]TWH86850.1 outer membrane receptor protein involved in Fe transport [Novosphingobium taihuense]
MSGKFKQVLKCTAVPLSGMVALALLASPAAAQSAAEDTGSANEIIVTAQKREERLRDVPVPVTAVGSGDLIAQNQTKAQDFFASVPGVNLQFQNNRAQLSIRGISTGPVSGNPVVGYTIDDAPFGASTGQGGLFGSAPDLDPSDLQRVEVLRGPQGTLYGASSMGGLVKYVTVDPDTKALSGSVAAGANLIKEGGEAGYNLRGALNVPVGETLAVRGSAFVRKEAGYIDNVRSGVKDANNSKVWGGRVSALWKPSDAFSLKLSGLYQIRDIYGSSNVDITTGSLYKQTDQIGSGRSRSETQMYTAELKAELGAIDVTSITAYSRAQNYDFLDFTASPLVEFAPIFPILFPGISPIGDVFRQGYNVDKVSHETRFSGSFGDNVDWIVGGFYTNEDANYDLDNYAVDPATGATLGVPINDGTGPQRGTIIVWRDTIKFKEYAGFGNLTVRLSDQFDVQFGGRYSHNDQDMFHHEWFQFDPYPNPPVEATNRPQASGSAFTYQISPRFKPSPDHMIYGRLASGYRPGGTNAVCGPLALPANVPCQFKPDKTVNYEVGAKGQFANGLFSYDLSVFNITWKDIQIVQVLDVFTYNGNAGRARSRGFEASFSLRPADGLTLSAWYSYVDAKLREEFVDANFFAQAGDRLPFSSQHSGRFSFDYKTMVDEEAELSFGGAATYVGERKGEFVPFEAAAPLRATYPGYVQFDLNASLEIRNLTLSAYVQNLTNKRGVIGGGFWNQTSYNTNWFNYSQPRTVGINAEVKF